MRKLLRRRSGWLMVLGVASFALPASALADTNHGSIAGVEYISDLADPSTDPGTAEAEAECEGSDEALGGGIQGTFSAPQSWASALTPFDADDSTRPDDGYRIRFNNGNIVDFVAHVWTICNSTAKTYVRKSTRLGDGATKTLSAKCPQGQQVSGGGGAVTRSIPKGIVQSSYPFDDDDVGAVPEDGWKVRVHNLSSNARKATVTAVCDSAGSTYVGDSVPVNPGSVGGFISCGATDFLVSGGVRVPGPPRKLRITQSYPGDAAADGDSVPDDRWNVGVANGTDEQRTFERFVICRD